MAIQSIVKRLLNLTIAAPFIIVAAGVVFLPSCASKTRADPPPQTPTAAEASPDGGFPAVPLHREGVVVPSDVKLEAAPSAATQPTAVVPSTTATPAAN